MSERVAVIISDELRKHIFKGELVRYVRSYITQRFHDEKEAISISDIMAEFNTLGFSYSEINLQFASDLSKGYIDEVVVGHYIPVLSHKR